MAATAIKLPPEEELFVSSSFNGPATKRRCTDVIFLAILVTGWLAMTLIGFSAIGVFPVNGINKGNIDRLRHGMDYMGNLCGLEFPVSHLKYKWEPNYNYITFNNLGDLVPSDLAICVDSCPASLESRSDPYGNFGSWMPILSTSAVLQYCVPVDTRRAASFAKDTFEDFYYASPVIGVLGFLLSVIFSFLFVAAVRVPLCLRLAIWSSVTIVFIVCAGGAYFLLEEANSQSKTSQSTPLSDVQITLIRSLGIALACIAALWFCLFAFLRKRIALAISLIRETTKVILSVPILMFAPLLNVIAVGLFTVIWIIYSIFLITSGEIVSVTSETLTGTYEYKRAEVNETSQKAFIFMVFMWIWTILFVMGAGQWICAHTVLTYYFTIEFQNVSSWQIVRSFSVFARYHPGTVAFGSLILAIIQFFRIILVYIKKRIGTKGGILVKAILCCCACCLYCLDKCVRFVDKNAYIQSALNGTPFCVSAKRALGLIFRNILRVATVSVVSDLVISIGKFSVAVCCAGCAYYYMSHFMADDLNGFVVPTLFVFLIAFVCSSMFLDSLSITSDTILQAYLIDEEMIANNVDGGASVHHHADKGLQDFMHSQQSNEESKTEENNINDIEVSINAEDESARAPGNSSRSRRIVAIGTSEPFDGAQNAEL